MSLKLVEKHFAYVILTFKAGHVKSLQFNLDNPQDVDDYRLLVSNNQDTVIISLPYVNQEGDYAEVTSNTLLINKADISYTEIKRVTYHEKVYSTP